MCVLLSLSLLYCSVATTVEMADDSFNEDHFEHIAGLLHVMWDRIPAGGNVTHAVIIAHFVSVNLCVLLAYLTLILAYQAS